MRSLRQIPAISVLWLCLCGLDTSAAERPVANFDESKVRPHVLPDPLVCLDGTRVSDVATWRARRRPELLELFSREVYGRTPAGRPDQMHWAVTSIDRAALGGKAVRKEITIWFSEKKNGPQMHLLVYQPPGAAGAHRPWPAFLGLNFYGNNCVNADPGITLSRAWMRNTPEKEIVDNRATEGTRGSSASGWEIETVVARGYATATVYYGDLCEDRSEGLMRDAGTLFGTRSTEERSPDEWGAIGIWAWGLSRAMDYLVKDPEIDGQHIALHGHSRLGKTALWAGAQDERFALVISNESGCGGAKLNRRDFGQTVADINIVFPFWFARNFRAYGLHEETLPIDQHELVALMAPRPVYVASAAGDVWSDPRGEFLSAKGAEPVYALFGRRGLGVDRIPPVDHPVVGDGLAYHIRTGKHGMMPYDWAQYLDFADRQFK